MKAPEYNGSEKAAIALKVGNATVQMKREKNKIE